MANQIVKINEYKILSSDSFFFDNNIWMILFCPIGNYKADKQRIYSRLFQELVSRKLPIYLSSLVLSEFSNRFLKLEHNILVKKNADYALRLGNYKRDFVGSPEYNRLAKDIVNIMRKIYSSCSISSDDFNSVHINNVFSNFFSIGFNDSYYLEMSSSKRRIIVTDDSDFLYKKLPVANATILTA